MPRPAPSLDSTTCAILGVTPWETPASRGEKLDTIKRWWENFISDLTTSGVRIDVDDWVQDVLRLSHLESNHDLQICVEKINFHNRIQKEIRDQILDLEQQLNSAFELTVESQIKLQMLMQREQQILLEQSNISKALHDAAIAVIQNIKE